MFLSRKYLLTFLFTMICVFAIQALFSQGVTAKKINMKAITDSIVINKPLSDVWDFLFVPENAMKWVSDLTSNEKLTPGEIKPGSKFLKKYNTGISFEEELTELIPQSKVKTEIRQQGFKLILTANFTVSGTGTLYAIQTTVEYDEAYAAFFTDDYMKTISQKIQKDMGKLKTLLEGN